MIKQIITCDLCNSVIPNDHGWEEEPRRFELVTFCSAQNPMNDVSCNGQHQENKFYANEVCSTCMRHMARVNADAIKFLASRKKA